MAKAAATAASEAAHDQYAAAGLACAACHPCGARAQHPVDWMDAASPGFHALRANGGLTACQGCHGPALDGVGGSTSVACAACHGTGWATRCTGCHGGTDGATGAPPRATFGQGSDPVRIGAHTAHLAATHGLGPAVACVDCHVVPADAFSPGHLDAPTATVRFAGLAVASGATAAAWSRAGATCSGTYCHGATLAGGALTAPAWTATDGAARSCGACHGAPPPTASHQRPGAACGACHPGYTLTTVNAATHLNAALDVSLTCTSCHGDPARAGAAAAAPPAGTRGETATTTRAVGAHLQHLQGGTLSAGIACGECHVVPTAMGHANGTVALAWGPLARTGGAAPAWSAATVTCSGSWCHGARLTGGTDTTPGWTRVDGSQDACGTCHGRPPSSGSHGMSEHRVSCGYCHAAAYTTTAVDRTLHVNGVVEVRGTRIRSWNPATRSCLPTCHGGETWGH